MTTLVIGGAGNIGRRYVAILKSLGVKCDIADPRFDGTMNIFRARKLPYQRIIIATPTDTHVDYIMRLIGKGIPILCEKPVTMSLAETRALERLCRDKKVFVVNNYAYALSEMERPCSISYDYFYTGPHGLYWDCCQLLVLDPRAKLSNTSPIWSLKNRNKMVSYRQLEESYVSMIRDFVKGRYQFLWTLDQAVIMAQRVEERLGKQDIDRNSSQDFFKKAPWQDLRANRRQIDA